MTLQVAASVRLGRVERRSAPAAAPRMVAGTGYLALLEFAFALFSSTRLLTYLPTLWAIHASGSSDQYSLLTWCAWVGSNLSMAAWLYEHNGRRINKAIVVLCGNAVMCLAACLVIGWYR